MIGRSITLFVFTTLLGIAFILSPYAILQDVGDLMIMPMVHLLIGLNFITPYVIRFVALSALPFIHLCNLLLPPLEMIVFEVFEILVRCWNVVMTVLTASEKSALHIPEIVFN